MEKYIYDKFVAGTKVPMKNLYNKRKSELKFKSKVLKDALASNLVFCNSEKKIDKVTKLLKMFHYLKMKKKLNRWAAI